jgi:predicted RND superfamily exporter protein
LIPNLVPLIITAGVMGYLGVDIKPSTAVIFTIAFGIAVDDSIHFLARLRVEIGRTANLREALAITTEKTGRAIILTSIILATGFGTLATSAFTSTMLMGILTCLTIVSALLADLFLLPSLLLWLRGSYRNESKSG